jgi:hypothetical protein
MLDGAAVMVVVLVAFVVVEQVKHERSFARRAIGALRSFDTLINRI